MKAIRLHPNPDRSTPYSAENPAPATALVLDTDLPIPQPLNPGEILIKVEATTIIRDALTWPESYLEEYAVPGNDFAGTVVAVHGASGEQAFKPGDEVYGMSDASRAGTWADYAVVLAKEACLKPKSLSWTQAAAMPLSALTAYQALFEKADLSPPKPSNLQKLRKSHRSGERGSDSPLLVTGATGGVGLYAIQLARLADLYVVAATRSKRKNENFLMELGADEVVEYEELAGHQERYQTIVDTVGGDILKNCWSLVQKTGNIVAIHSASYSFVEEHQNLGLTRGKEEVKAMWFVVSPSGKNLDQLLAVLDLGLLEIFVASVLPLADAHSAYGLSSAPTARDS